MNAIDSNQAAIRGFQNQVEGIREIFLEFDNVATIKRDIRRFLHRDNKVAEGAVMMLEGDSRSGKSKLIRSLLNEIEESDAADPIIVEENGERANRLSAVLITMPDAIGNPVSTVKNLSERLLAALSDGQRVESSERRFSMENNIEHYARARHTCLVILDESHQAANHAQAVALRIKDFANLGVFSTLIVGTKEVNTVLHAKEELANRCLLQWELAPLDVRTVRGRADCLELLAAWDDHLAENVFGQRAGLASVYLTPRIWYAGKGVIGQMATLIENAAMLAVYDLVEGKGQGITTSHLGEAYDSWPFGRGRVNPFSRTTRQGVDRVALPLPSPKRLPGTRRAGYNRNFRP